MFPAVFCVNGQDKEYVVKTVGKLKSISAWLVNVCSEQFQVLRNTRHSLPRHMQLWRIDKQGARDHLNSLAPAAVQNSQALWRACAHQAGDPRSQNSIWYLVTISEGH
jgi:hypothetical protein